nr:hypothetical protein [Pseudobutyrivibrio sp.]
SVDADTPQGKEMVDALYEKGIKYDNVEDAISKISVSFRDIHPEAEPETLEVEIAPRNDKAYERISRGVIDAGAKIRDKKEVVKPTEEDVEQPNPIQINPEENNVEPTEPQDSGMPEQQMSEQQMPEQQMPEQQMPEQQMPEQQMPEQQMPEQQMPEQQMPEQQMPEQQMPEQQMPEQQMPEQQMPEQQMPEQQMPEQNMPGNGNNPAGQGMPDRGNGF